MKFDGIPVRRVGDDELELANGSVVRGYNPDLVQVETGEAAPAVQVSNAASLRQQAATALQANRDFLAIPAPSNAQVLAQVKALTRQNNGLIRLVLNRFEGTD